MAMLKLAVELSAVAALAAVVLGGFYCQGARIDKAAVRLDERIDGMDQRLARIEGLLEGWLSGPPTRSSGGG